MTVTHDVILTVGQGRQLGSSLVLRVWLALLVLPSVTAPCGARECGVVDCAAVAPCDVECGFGSIWFRGDVLLWWTNRGGNPALVTTSPASTSPEQAGRLSGPTTILLGGDDLSPGVTAGGRFTIGWWFDGPGSAGLEASYFFLGDTNTSFEAASPDPSILARPFFDMQTDSQGALLIAHPEFLLGSIHVDLDSRLQGFGVSWRHGILRGCWHRTDVLLGYRLLEFDEQLRIASDSRFAEPWGQVIAGTTRNLFDQFDVSNRFHGAELGLAHYHQLGHLTAEVSLKVAFGGTTSDVDVDGRTVNTVPGHGSAEFPGGLFAQTTNIGSYHAGRFAAVPELGVNLGYDLTPSVRILCGYHLIVWPQVMRAVDQVDVRMSQLPPEPQTGLRLPEFSGTTSTFVAQGLQLGLQLVW